LFTSRLKVFFKLSFNILGLFDYYTLLYGAGSYIPSSSLTSWESNGYES